MAILRPATFANAWGRALLALLVSFGFTVLGALGAMHAPPAWGGYTLWLVVHFLGGWAWPGTPHWAPFASAPANLAGLPR